MVDTTWNRFSLMVQQGKLNGNEKTRLLLSSGLDVFKMDIACLTRIDSDHITVMNSNLSGWQNIKYHLRESLCQFTIEHQRVIASNDLKNTDWNDYSVIENLRFGAYIGVPIYIEKQVYGTLFFASYTPRLNAFSAREEAFLKMMATSFRPFIEQPPII